MGENHKQLQAVDTGEALWLDLAGFCLLKYQKDQQQIKAHYKNWQDSTETQP
jgi:hypothetical protein